MGKNVGFPIRGDKVNDFFFEFRIFKFCMIIKSNKLILQFNNHFQMGQAVLEGTCYYIYFSFINRGTPFDDNYSSL